MKKSELPVGTLRLFASWEQQKLKRLPDGVVAKYLAAHWDPGSGDPASWVVRKLLNELQLHLVRHFLLKYPPDYVGVLGDWLEDKGLDRNRLGQSVMDLLERTYGRPPKKGRYESLVWHHDQGHRLVTSGRAARDRLFYQRPGLRLDGGPRGKEIMRLDQLQQVLDLLAQVQKGNP